MKKDLRGICKKFKKYMSSRLEGEIIFATVDVYSKRESKKNLDQVIKAVGIDRREAKYETYEQENWRRHW